MVWRLVVAQAVLGSVAAAVIAPAPPAPRPGREVPRPAATAPAPTRTAVGLLALRPGDLDATDPSRFDVVIMNAWEAGRIGDLRRRNPDIVILVYKDMSSTRSYAAAAGVDDTLLPTGVGWADADRRRPEWFLTDDQGRRTEWKGYSGHWWMDVGNPDYAEAWTANVAAETTAAGWDGVMVDNVMATPRSYLEEGRTLARYPDDASYTAATDRFLAVAATRLRAAGLAVVPNLGGRFPDDATYQRWVRLSSGALREHYGRWGSDGRGEVLTGDAWAHQLQLQETAQAADGMFVAVSYARPDDAGFQRYARASFLLAWDGGPSSLVLTPPTPGREPRTPDGTADVGVPTAPRTAVESAWLRPYSRGVVVVNPSPTAAATVPLGGTYAHPDHGKVARVTLPPASGVVLTSTA